MQKSVSESRRRLLENIAIKRRYSSSNLKPITELGILPV
jgi:hypothetical protein